MNRVDGARAQMRAAGGARFGGHLRLRTIGRI
jgi:hypothetical protein